ncbi:unnamed protein product [Adineta steineri]|uniref:CUB domain-containing protein n=1 Tax=Adineta steineri TaxID=433720 RepID=A0A814MIT3_9BILA|nr:unnamed protein product [Adineta steineri]CAF1078553.1 unnamed protein product [Adineta steineri]CAF3572480.1 unnamed protein product [Adineta steineri]CAF3611601.1 unnamed protein product [Adineta steineri]
MARINRYILLTVLVLFIEFTNAKAVNEKIFMDKLCGSGAIVLDGDVKPGTAFQLSSSTKFQPNFSCTIKFRTAQPTQRLVITVEQLNIADCPGDTLRIYDGTTLLNQDVKQQCGTPSSFTFTTKTTEASFTFATGKTTKTASFKIAMAIHFAAVPSCPQNLGFYLCKNKNCISKSLKCDAHDHCGDATDEFSCAIIGK